MANSLAEDIAELSAEEQAEIFKGWTDEQFEKLKYDASFWLRPEQKVPDGDWFITALVAGRGFGKGILLDTPIPTPTGWTTIGEIKTGDQVFDESGTPCNVVEAHAPYTPTKLYRLTFADGTNIVVDGDHLWTTWTARDRKSYNRRNDYINSDESVGLPENWYKWAKNNKNGTTDKNPVGPSTRSTQEIVDTFRHGKRGDLNHSVPVIRPLQYPAQDLPIDPYVFGAWLGDGSADSGSICSHSDEVEWLAQMFTDRGYAPIKEPKRQRDTNCHLFTAGGLRKALRLQGSLQKAVPPQYLIGSEQQRRDLLAGLLDTDGFTDPRTNYIEFCAKRKEHADVVMELARSLGQKPRMYEGRATLNGVDHGTKYRVQWRPTENFFYMPRKAEAFVPLNGQASRSMHRMITSYEELPVQTVRCLTVDSDSRLFVVAEGHLITHNTLTASQWIRRKALENPGCRIAIAARTVADVRNTMILGEALALDTPVATPTGFTAMGDLKAGDKVIGGDGNECTVIHAFPVLYGRPCYEVDISGQKIVADAEHKWETWNFDARVSRSEGRKRTKHTKSVVTTEEIKNTLKKQNQNNHGILSTVLTGSETDLPIDPYILGYWLGDGTSKSSEFTCHTDDQPYLIKRLTDAGYSVSERKGDYIVGVKGGLYKQLRLNKLLKNKNIPSAYLRSTFENRLSLLQGMIDSDGHVTKTGSVEFSNKDAKLIEQVYELASSLGIRAAVYGQLNGGPQLRVTFVTSLPVATLPRKAARIRSFRDEHNWRYVRSVEGTTSVPVRCITVDSPDHTFLITRALVRTHNSGVLAVHAPEERPEYKPSTTSLHWPNGTTALLLSSESPDGARGPQFHYAVGDEFAAWKTNVDSSGATLFSNLVAATRLGANPQLLLATTPKRTKVMRDLMEDAKDPKRRIKIVTGSTFDNKSLSKNYIDNLVGQYGNSDLAKQELDGQMLEDAEGLVFTQEMIDKARDETGVLPYLPLKFVAVDPSVSENPNDECGIMVVGCTQERDLTKRKAYILEDYSLKAGPDVWSKVVVQAAREWNTRFVVYEKNQGGALIQMAINAVDDNLKTFPVVATRGKQTRAEPVVIAMQQGRVRFNGLLAQLEDQCIFWDPEESRYSPDRMDAMVWGITAALITPPPGLRMGNYSAQSHTGRRLPTGLGTGRARATGSLRNRK